MTDSHYHLAVIGGGIHGAGVAQAAAAAGLKTLIVEQRDWASATSSRSSKLLHGGLRYLETAQFSLVRESLQERNLLLSLAPSLAHPLRFNIPIYRNTSRRPWQLICGLSIYALFSGFNPLSRFSWWRSPPAGLNTRGLQRVFSYWDGQTNDRLLTRAVIHSALEIGAEARCPSELVSARQVEGGYELTLGDSTGSVDAVRTDFLVNCTGPWVNDMLSNVSPTPVSMPCDLVKGSHLVLAEKLSDEAFYLESPQDQRAVFLLPWGEHSLLGTTEQRYDGDPRTVSVSAGERDYLLQTANHYFPQQSFTIIEEFAGLRVLPTGSGRAFSRPRDCILHTDPDHPRLISLYGGKLTTYRHTAATVIRQALAVLGPRPPLADTRELALQLPDQQP